MSKPAPSPRAVLSVDDLDISPPPAPASRPTAQDVSAVATASQFTSREPAPVAAPPLGIQAAARTVPVGSAPLTRGARPSIIARQHTTGRNMQLSLKVTFEAKAQLYAMADDFGWTVGEALGRAVEALMAQTQWDAQSSPAFARFQNQQEGQG